MTLGPIPVIVLLSHVWSVLSDPSVPLAIVLQYITFPWVTVTRLLPARCLHSHGFILYYKTPLAAPSSTALMLYTHTQLSILSSGPPSPTSVLTSVPLSSVHASLSFVFPTHLCDTSMKSQCILTCPYHPGHVLGVCTYSSYSSTFSEASKSFTCEFTSWFLLHIPTNFMYFLFRVFCCISCSLLDIKPSLYTYILTYIFFC